MVEDIIKQELIKFRKQFFGKIKKRIFYICLCITIILCFFNIFFNALESATISGRFSSSVGMAVIIFGLGFIAYLCFVIEYACVNPHKFNYIRGCIAEKIFFDSHMDYANTNTKGKPSHRMKSYYFLLKGEKLRRKTYSWVYRKAVVNQRYIIVLSGKKKKSNNKVIFIMPE